jgi:hypothetical protein
MPQSHEDTTQDYIFTNNTWKLCLLKKFPFSL